ncbi:hypothetical protein IQ257_13320 [Coleofasciculus sp. LEGE 07092]|nr:hypothetical protein [Coleofasciculus sp. LEGE 07081]MBE9149458.1 hypothetical protein [Coleofasciculus sp. LEGE 07092]
MGAIAKRCCEAQIAAALVSSLAAPVQAQDMFENRAIQFSEDTIVEFEFLQSHGSYLATLGVRNETTGEETVLFREIKAYDAFGTGQVQGSSRGQNDLGSQSDFVGTVNGGTVASRFSEFTFKANNRYVFFLESVSPTGQTRRNILSTQNFTRFMGSLDGGSTGNITGTRLSWEDGGQVEVGSDDDFDDFVIEAGGYLVDFNCPPIL